MGTHTEPMFPELVGTTDRKSVDNTTTFGTNMNLSVHSWYRYTAGFSADWCRQLIEAEKLNGRTHILDPFAGSGTTILEASLRGVEGIGLDSHPFISRIAKAKMQWDSDIDAFDDFSNEVLRTARSNKVFDPVIYPDLIHRCYTQEFLIELDSLRRAYEATEGDGAPKQLTWLALASILRPSSHVGTAQWQYVLPNKKKSKDVKGPFDAFKAKVLLMKRDMEALQREAQNIEAIPSDIREDDARQCSSVQDSWADLVITSPPYANNYDYADATRLEMSFFGEISGWKDLQSTVRKHLIRSCTQHVAGDLSESERALESDVLKPIRDELTGVWLRLQKERANHGGNKPYHAMIASYFFDLAFVWQSLNRVCSNDAKVCFVIGDSAPYGIYVPVDQWLGKLALAAGFGSCEFEKTRDRNVKWKNRKHTVPLHEGRLWVSR